jgi:hypothetical protein
MRARLLANLNDFMPSCDKLLNYDTNAITAFAISNTGIPISPAVLAMFFIDSSVFSHQLFLGFSLVA